MKLLKTVAIMLLMAGADFAQVKVSPVISMTWDWNDEEGSVVVDQRFGVQASIDDDRYYGIDTDGTDHRTFFGWKFVKLGIGIPAASSTETIYTIGATYNVVAGLNTEIEYVGKSGASANSFIRVSLAATF